MASTTLLSPATVNLLRRNSSILAATANPQLPPINFLSSGSLCRSIPRWNSKLRRGRCGGATSSHPPPPPESGPPPGDDEDSDLGSVASLSRFQESVQIFFAVFFWMSLFFWSSVWDGRKNGRSDKGPRFWK